MNNVRRESANDKAQHRWSWRKSKAETLDAEVGEFLEHGRKVEQDLKQMIKDMTKAIEKLEEPK